MVFIGGYHCSRMPQLQLFDMADVAIFDTALSVWKSPPEITGIAPKPRLFHSAIVAGMQFICLYWLKSCSNNGSGPNNDIFVCGGQDHVRAPYHTYIGSQRDQLEDMTAILDTNTWVWRVPTSSVYQPLPQSHASISIVNDTKVVYGFGRLCCYHGGYFFLIHTHLIMLIAARNQLPNNL